MIKLVHTDKGLRVDVYNIRGELIYSTFQGGGATESELLDYLSMLTASLTEGFKTGIIRE